MKILFLTDNFPPEVNAPASRTYEHCREWVKQGAEVTVITCAPNFPQGKVYPGYKNRLYSKETIEGIRVIRVWSYIVANKGFLKRTLDFISYSVSAFIAGLFVHTDLIIATSPQFFTALSGRALAFWKRKPWVMEVRDLWPESIKTVGAMKDNLFIRYFEWQEKRCYRSARRIIVVTDSFKKKLTERSIPSSKIAVIKNGVDRRLFTPMPKDEQLLNELGLQGKTIIGYIGTHGMAHKLDFILECAKHIEKRQPRFHFLFLGNGAEKQHLLQLKEKLDCRNVTMLNSVPKTEVKRYISILDICLINLKKSELFTTVIPSKIFENAAMRIPILMGVDGEAREIVETYGAGKCFEPENEKDFLDKLNQLQDKQIYADCQEGCTRLAADFDRKHLALRMFDELKTLF
ncbi:glycosyltransferase family 4 protein [Bacteroides acidifaciens]|uniref:glycosyltransferase family 4 protein n=1 Tax=Bacteroides acidifaciens TaxID=85831 RepID=UPI00258B565E|nr:glycosyltransferase family 4 protein [Bacteroides acidifaciens]